MAGDGRAITEQRHGEHLLTGLVVAALIGGLSVTDARAILEPGAELDPSAAAAITEEFAAQGPVELRVGGLGGPLRPTRVGRPGGRPIRGLPGVPAAPLGAEPGGLVPGDGLPDAGLVPDGPAPTDFASLTPTPSTPGIPGVPALPGIPGGTTPPPVDEVFPVDPAPAVPEPATWAMLMIGFLSAGFMLRRRKTLVTAR
ncbi:PEPxxWA-CTERM sorting domain-containing protein [Sphingomonas sp. 1P06PA]|uniref:PEPxxWA-CTERM sorting domain-containing protein n=1 Tax=Sphingomonas sp. 1P06PA TaxID=554121 RepID=UPI0039A5E2EB